MKRCKKTEKNPSTNAVDNTVVFRGVIEPTIFSSDQINELALVTGDEAMVAHWVSPAIPSGPDAGRAEKYVKTDLLWMSIEWAITFSVNS